jgi:Sulfatase-modifying factor enzyme 1
MPNCPLPIPNSEIEIPGGEFYMGSDAAEALDNERSRHLCYLEAYSIDRYPVTCGQYRNFMQSGGYQNPDWWSADGWKWLQGEAVDRPLYWSENPTTIQFAVSVGTKPKLTATSPASVCHRKPNGKKLQVWMPQIKHIASILGEIHNQIPAYAITAIILQIPRLSIAFRKEQVRPAAAICWVMFGSGLLQLLTPIRDLKVILTGDILKFILMENTGF